ncbi:MAG: hypothetical protein QOJ42_1987 [Acidobacteriaceae bacterium]|nr:hypothetical protein [Acidobacteriaceae bacterium]
MSNFKRFAAFVVVTTIVPALHAEPHCPGNVASLPLRLTNSHQMIAAVSINHSGPYNFSAGYRHPDDDDRPLFGR